MSLGSKALRVVLIALLIVSAGCLPRFHRASKLVEEGRYVEAAELLERLAAQDPLDPELAYLVPQARQLALEQTLKRARETRLTGDANSSQRHFAEGLMLRTRWNLKLSGALESTVEDEREEATRRLRSQARPHVERGEGLSLQQLMADREFLLRHPELASLRAELEGQAAVAGRATCQKLRPEARATSPYLLSAISKYCSHFQTEAPQPVPLSDTFHAAALKVDVAPSHPLATALAGSVVNAVNQSAWRAEAGPSTAALTLEGRIEEHWSQTPLLLSAGWTERVPYKESVKKTVETSVPVTECEVTEAFDSYANGGKGGRVQQVKEVERKKRGTKEVWVEETRWRNVPRVFEYQALREERVTHYRMSIALQMNGVPLAAEGMEDRQALHGFTHGARFEPAGVTPARTALPPLETWAGERNEALVRRLTETLGASWHARFCAQSAFTPEEAARCARANLRVPTAATDALTPLLGADAALLPRLLD